MLRPRLAGSILALSAVSSAATLSATAASSSFDVVDFCFTHYSEFLSASGTPVLVTSTDTATIPIFSQSSLITSSTEINTFTFTTTLVPTPYTPPAECFTGCVIDVSKVQLIYWPTPKPDATKTGAPEITSSPALPKSAVVNGSTLVSPSNYIVFTSLIALQCPFGGSPCTTIGKPVPLTTLAFGQNELSSEECFLNFNTINYADFNTPIPWSIVSNQPGCTTLGNEASHDPASPADGFTLDPVLRFPDEVRTAVDPLWASCSFIDAAFDPPTALSPVAPPTPTPSTSPDASPTPTPSEPASPTSIPSQPASPTQSSAAAPSDPPPPASSSPALPDPPAQSSSVVPPNPPAQSSSPAVPSKPPAESPPVESPPAVSTPADPNPPPGASLPVDEVSTPPPAQPTEVNNNGTPPPATSNGDSGSGGESGNAGASPAPSGDSGTGSGSDGSSGSNTAIVPNDPPVTQGDALPSDAPAASSVTMSLITIVTTTNAVAGSGSDTVGGQDSTGFTDGATSFPNGTETASPTVVRSEAGALMRGLTISKGMAIAMLFAVLM